MDLRRIRLHRKIKNRRRRLVPLRYKSTPRWKKEWKRELSLEGICSYPPEDLVIEGYAKYLKKKALEIKTLENQRIEPFVSSLGDGIDIRETIRQWLKGSIYIKHDMGVKGQVGSVVVIFDPDLPQKGKEEEFPWKVTWLGEHSQESDMAFYSTYAGQEVVGPGISRCVYGGFMMTYPPMRLYDIWQDPYFDLAQDKPERLLWAALDYSLEDQVVYVAKQGPSPFCQRIARLMGKKIIYIPIGSLSQSTLARIRYFHVLDGHPVREYAHRYIRRT